jgi:hypothetical protein
MRLASQSTRSRPARPQVVSPTFLTPSHPATPGQGSGRSFRAGKGGGGRLEMVGQVDYPTDVVARRRRER